MKLTVDFAALEMQVEKISSTEIVYNPAYFVADRTKGFLDNVALFAYLPEGLIFGEDIPFEDISAEFGVLEYMGQQVMLYIEDQAQLIAEVLLKGNRGGRVHIAECKTFETMKNKEKSPSYCVISRMDGKFPVYGVEPGSKRLLEGDAALSVCKDCLETLNYKGYMQLRFGQKNALLKEFNFVELFKIYSSYFKSLPRRMFEEENTVYSSDWPVISAQLIREVNQICQSCAVDLKEHPSLLNVNHINGDKSDNDLSNLQVLCLSCFKQQSQRADQHVKHSSVLIINRLRKRQNVLEPFNYQKLELYADCALVGLIAKCRKHNLPLAEIGTFIEHENETVNIDLAWTGKKIAILLDKSKADIFVEQGWRVFSAHQALKDFNSFQKKIR